MMRYSKLNVEQGDYVILRDCEADGFYKVTKTHDECIDAVDGFGTPTGASYSDIKELRLEGEVPGTCF